MTLVDRLPQWLSGNESACSARDTRDVSSILGLGRCPGGEMQPTPVFLPGESHGQSLVGYSPWSPTHTTLVYKQILGDYILGAG